jgi:alginate O-acetyltransferase complex protein AlgJ
VDGGWWKKKFAPSTTKEAVVAESWKSGWRTVEGGGWKGKQGLPPSTIHHPPSTTRLADRAIIVLLLGSLWLPLSGLAIKHEAPPSGRQPVVSFPRLLEDGGLVSFPARLDKFYSENFGFRGTLIRFSNIAKVRWLGISTAASVIIGQGAWLFHTHAPISHDVPPFTHGELLQWQRVLEQRQHWLARRGCRYLVFIPPDKQTIYPEYLPPVPHPHHPQSRLDQLLEHMRAHSTVPIIDVRADLLQAKERERLYHITDSHWNDRGAFVGYHRVAQALAEWFPVIHPLPREAFEEDTHLAGGGDLAEMIGLAHRTREERLDLRPRIPRRAIRHDEGMAMPAGIRFALGKPYLTECDDPRLPRAVVFHDSFGLPMQPFLSEHFSRSVWYWIDDFLQEVVEQERPDVVIHQLLERKLVTVTPNEIK